MSAHVKREINPLIGLCSMKTEEEERSPENRNTLRGSSPLSDSMISEMDDEIIVNAITHEPQDSREVESVASNEMFGADLQRTLGEILAFCQITYGAILKLDEKFEMLQTKVSSIQAANQIQAFLPQGTHLSSSQRDIHGQAESGPTSDTSMPLLVHISSSPPIASVEARKPPTLSPGPELSSPPQLMVQNLSKPTEEEPVRKNKMTLMPPKNIKKLAENNLQLHDSSSDVPKTCLGSSDRKVFLPSGVLQRASKMARPDAAVRFLTRNIFTVEELAQSSNTGSTSKGLKRLDANKISAIREWAAKRFPKFDLRAKGRDWKTCLSRINSTTRYYRFMNKTRKVKVQDRDESTSATPAPAFTCGGAAEIDVELSDSDSESKPQDVFSDSDGEAPADAESDTVYLGPPHRNVKVPEFALSAAIQRSRPELIARYLIKFIFSDKVLVRSNVYGGARRGIQPLDHNKISALREHLFERFSWMKLEEDGSDWKICVGAINSCIRKLRYEHKMGIKRGKR